MTRVMGGDPTTITIEFDRMPPVILRGNGRPGHWSSKHWRTQLWHDDTLVRLWERELPDSPWGHVTIQYTAYYCGKPIDADNLIIGMKAPQDAIVTAGIVEDDSHHYVTVLPVKYVRVDHRHQIKLVMEITETERTG